MEFFWFPSRALCVARSLLALRILTLAMRIKGSEHALRDRAVLLDFIHSTRMREVLMSHSRFIDWMQAGHATMAALGLKP